MEARSFAGFNPRPSPWGYNWTTDNLPTPPLNRDSSAQNSPASTTSTSSPEPQMMANQFINMPAALLNNMKRDKKPFTYTPGGVNLSEVLNARLQKRLERKKRYYEDRVNDKISIPSENLPKFDPPKQVIVMPTYNSALDMYSMENALEVLEAQAELVANDKSLSACSRSATLPRNYTFQFNDLDSNRGVAQSNSFKVLQIITDTDEEPSNKGKAGSYQDEMRFTGIRDSKTIPSKFFHTLQKITGTDDDNEEDNSREMARVEVPRPVTQEKQPTRPGFLPQHKQMAGGHSAAQRTGMQNHVAPQFQPMRNHKMVSDSTNSQLKRPAAFLPMKTGSNPMGHVKPVHPPFLVNGPRKALNPSGPGTDF